jgi:hypothetical protein
MIGCWTGSAGIPCGEKDRSRRESLLEVRNFRIIIVEAEERPVQVLGMAGKERTL